MRLVNKFLDVVASEQDAQPLIFLETQGTPLELLLFKRHLRFKNKSLYSLNFMNLYPFDLADKGQAINLDDIIVPSAESKDEEMSL